MYQVSNMDEHSSFDEDLAFLNKAEEKLYSSLIKKYENYNSALESKRNNKHIQEACSRKAELENECNSLNERRTQLEKQLEEMNLLIESHKAINESQCEKLSICQKTNNLYSKHCGLRIENNSEGLSFIFTQINEKKPDDCVILGLQVEDSYYKVTKCEPDMSDKLDYLVCQLNMTHDISAFLVDCRKLFCRSVE